MNPGRDLDALVAEKAMGWTDIQEFSELDIIRKFKGRPPELKANEYLFTIPEYSTDIAAAWEIVEKLSADYGTQKLSFVVYYDYEISAWVAKFYGRKENYLSHEDPMDGSETAPHAICLAALKAVGVKVE